MSPTRALCCLALLGLIHGLMGAIIQPLDVLSKLLHLPTNTTPGAGGGDKAGPRGREVPLYLSELYEAERRLNQFSDSLPEQTVCALSLLRESVRAAYISLYYEIPTRVCQGPWGRAELVFPIFGAPKARPRPSLALQVCSRPHVGCTRPRLVTAEPLVLHGRLYDVFDVTAIARKRLTSRSKRARRLHVRIPRSRYGQRHNRVQTGDPLLVLHANASSANELRKMLTSPDVPRSRFVRSAQFTQFPQGACSLVPWHVDFKVIGWDAFIVHPQGYNGNMCLGQCGLEYLSDHVTMTNHARVRLEMRTRAQRGSFVPEGGCVPERLAPINVIIKKGNAYIMKAMADMSVLSCVCS